MTIRALDTSFDKKRFNAAAIHPLQSWEWGEARKKMGIEVLRLGEFSKDQLENVYQLTFHVIPLPGSYKIGYLPRSRWPSKSALDFIAEYAKKNNVVFVKIEPYEFGVKPKSLPRSPHPLFPEWSQILNLNTFEGDLLKSMRPKTRYNIRLAQKKGVIVKEMSDEKGFEIFSRLYFDTCRRQKYFGHTPHYHKTVWEGLKKDIAHIFVASYKDTPLAAYELFRFHDVLYYPYGGTSPEYRNFMAANLLMWESIRFGKKLGAKYFDMWGSLPPQYNEKHPWSGFTRFKQGYGGKFVQFVGSYDLIINPFGYRMYNIIYNLRDIYLQLRKAF